MMTVGIYGAHAFLIIDINKVKNNYTCGECLARFTQTDNLVRHAKTCTRGQTNIACSGNRIVAPESAFEKAFYPDRIPPKRNETYPHAIVYDFEAYQDKTKASQPTRGLSFESEHVPVLVSIADTLDPEPEYICSKDPEELIRLFYQPLVHRSEAIREDVTQKYMPPDLEGLTKDQQNLINQWCDQVPVIGFNSGRYDLHLNRKYVVSHLGQENGVFAGEKQGQIMYISTAQFWLKLPKFSATFGKGSLFFFCLLQQIGCRKVFNLLKKKKLNYRRNGLLWNRWGYDAWKQLPNTSCRRMFGKTI